MGTMMSAASSTERFPAPVPIGGTVRLVNSHSCAWCRVARHARATPSRVTGSVALWMIAWMTNSAGRSPPPAVTTAAPTASSFWTWSPRVKSAPPTVSSRRRADWVGSGRVVAGVDLRRAPQVGHRVAPQPATREQHAEARERLPMDRVHPQRPLVILLRRAVVRRSRQQPGPLDQERHVVWVRREGVVERRLG